MDRIAIVTDSTCDLPQDFLKEHQIHVLPLRIIYRDREYRDRVEITPEEIYARFGEEIPKSSLPSPEDVGALFEGLISQGYTHILGIFVSSGLSGTYNMVRTVTEDLQGAVIELVDSKSLSLGLGYPVMAAARTLAAGGSFEAMQAAARKAIEGTTVFYVIKTLEYLRKGGRIGLVEGTLGDLLNIKPIISVNREGVYYTFRKVRGRSKSVQELYTIGLEQMQDRPCRVAVLHGEALEEAAELVEQFKGLGNVQEVILEQISPVLAVHTGPGLVGVIVSAVTD